LNGSSTTFLSEAEILIYHKEVKRTRGKLGFTMIELMVVITIIGILLGIVLPVLIAVRKRAQRVQTISLINECSLASQNYLMEYNQYPWMKKPLIVTKMNAGLQDEVEIKTYRVMAELTGQGGEVNKTQDFLGAVSGKFINEIPVGTDTVRTLVDSWQTELLFRIDPTGGEPVIWSCGENMTDDTNDGTTTDAIKYPQIYYYFGNAGEGDDLGTL
jgi:prepilin-type N-terminal cleavage/methylation domain-containing protein